MESGGEETAVFRKRRRRGNCGRSSWTVESAEEEAAALESWRLLEVESRRRRRKGVRVAVDGESDCPRRRVESAAKEKETTLLGNSFREVEAGRGVESRKERFIEERIRSWRRSGEEEEIAAAEGSVEEKGDGNSRSRAAGDLTEAAAGIQEVEVALLDRFKKIEHMEAEKKKLFMDKKRGTQIAMSSRDGFDLRPAQFHLSSGKKPSDEQALRFWKQRNRSKR